MKIYVLYIDMTLILPRLKKYRLQEFNSQFPIIFIEAEDPDDACYKCSCKFTEILLKQDYSKENAEFIKNISYELRILKVYNKDEKKL